MKNFSEEAKKYASSYKSSLGKYLHFSGVLFSILSIFIFLSYFHVGIVKVGSIDFATIAAITMIAYYFKMDWKLAIVSTVILLIVLWIATLFSYGGPTEFSLWAFIITLIIGAGLMFAAFSVEGEKPGYKKVACELLSGPMVLSAELFCLANMMPNIKKLIYPEKKKSKSTRK